MTADHKRMIGARLREVREAHPYWTRGEMARILRDQATPDELPFIAHVRSLTEMIGQWEKGQYIPRHRYQLLYCRLTGRTEDELFPPAPPQNPLLNATQAVPASRGTVNKSPTPDQGDDEVKRRDLLQNSAALTAGVTVAPVLAALTQAWQDSEPPLPGASVSQAMIDDCEEAAIVHGRRARVEPPAVALAGLAADFATMAPHLARRQPDAVQRDLAHAAASHALLIAGKFVDLGNRRESRRWWAKSRTLADRSGDRMLSSWIRSREALYRRGDPTENLAEVLSVAQEARRLAGDKPSASLVSALCAEAQTLALMRRTDEAVTAITKAEASFGTMTTPSFVDPEWVRREEGLWYDKSLIYTRAGDVRRATEAHDILLGPDGEDVTKVQVRIHQAVLEARADPAQGLHKAAEILDSIPPERRRTRFLSAARITLEVVPRKALSLPAARDLRALTSDV